MAQYDRYVLDGLIDSYERSVLFTGENKVNVKVAFLFDRKKIPDYFNESSLAYERIHACMKEMEGRGFLKIDWKKGRENHIISKVVLQTDKLQEIYAYLNRTPKSDYLKKNLLLVSGLQKEFNTPVCGGFLSYIRERLEGGKSVKDYIELSETEKTERLFRTVYLIETNRIPCYIREFSIRHFSDSKTFEGMLGAVTKVMHTFGADYKEMTAGEILAEYQIYDTPDYVYFKGDIVLAAKDKELAVGVLRQGIGLSGEDIAHIELRDFKRIKKVITIENLTTFFRWNEENSLILYLGGYHNSVRRSLLTMIYRKLPCAQYYHFGDIDAGGFAIYEDLCAKTQIPFRLYKMDLDTLKRYERYARPLTANDRSRIRHMIDSKKRDYEPVLSYMLEKNIKLEQEAVIN